MERSGLWRKLLLLPPWRKLAWHPPKPLRGYDLAPIQEAGCGTLRTLSRPSFDVIIGDLDYIVWLGLIP